MFFLVMDQDPWNITRAAAPRQKAKEKQDEEFPGNGNGNGMGNPMENWRVYWELIHNIMVLLKSIIYLLQLDIGGFFPNRHLVIEMDLGAMGIQYLYSVLIGKPRKCFPTT